MASFTLATISHTFPSCSVSGKGALDFWAQKRQSKFMDKDFIELDLASAVGSFFVQQLTLYIPDDKS